MAAIAKLDYEKMLDEQKREVRKMILDGVNQVREGKTKDFNAVCERLEKKYRDEAISD